MRRYEMMVIITDTIDDEAVEAVLGRVKDAIAAQSGEIVAEAVWGKRQLAYEIDKRRFGHYVVFDLLMSSEGLTEVERQLKINDNIVRYKTVRPELRVHKTA